MMPLTQAIRKTPAIGNISGDSAMINTSFWLGPTAAAVSVQGLHKTIV
jgi:hypothetical protein